ncbi:lysophospholipase [Prolixibacter sp. SD074]|nr:lysophospholipase [Prolixibacter sp. SD074]
MKFSEYKWESFDGLEYYAVSWAPDIYPKAVLALVHGHGEHCRRYDHWLSRFPEKGLAAVAFDYRGHGRSGGKRGVLRYYADFLQDVELLLRKTRELFPGIPVILFGHSMGGNMVLSYCLRRAAIPQLAIITSPWIMLRKKPRPVMTAAACLANRLTPRLTFKTGLKSKDFSEDKPGSEPRGKDDLLHNRISVRLFCEVKREGEWLLENAYRLNIPVLLMQGLDDPIMDSNAGLKLFDNAAEKITYRGWHGARHQLHEFDDEGEVLRFIFNWIEQNI